MAWALTQWSFDPIPVIGCAVAALLYVAGSRATPRSERRSRSAPLAFWTGLALLFAALVSPLDGLDLRWQWVHMTQHVLVLLAAPPLLIIGDAFGTVWRGVQALSADATAPPRAVVKTMRWLRATTPGSLMVLFLFCADLLLWHVPALYDLTLNNQGVHDLEHLSFLVTGIVFWDQVLAPLTAARGLGWRTALVLSGMAVSWALAVIIGYASRPLYAYPQSPGLSLLQDQQIAAGIMWVPGSIPFVAALIWILVSWFELDQAQSDALQVDAR